MPYNLTQARALCTMPEYKLFEASSAKAIKGLSPAELKDKMTRARNARDKYRDLHKRQRLAARARTGSKKGERSESNVRTEKKAKLFDEVLARFRKRADTLKSKPQKKTNGAAKRAPKARVATSKDVAKGGAARPRAQAKPKANAKAGSGLAGAARKVAAAAVTLAAAAAAGSRRTGGKAGKVAAAAVMAAAAATRGRKAGTGTRRQARRDNRGG